MLYYCNIFFFISKEAGGNNMDPKAKHGRMGVVIGACLICMTAFSGAFAWDNDYYGRQDALIVAGVCLTAFTIAVIAAAVSPHRVYRVVAPYPPYPPPNYYFDGRVYRPLPQGYIAPGRPAVAPAAAQPPAVGGTITINVPASDGSFTPVTLTRQKDGYIGPQGEFYPDIPSIAQLKILYGK
jgi:MFS family permease